MLSIDVQKGPKSKFGGLLASDIRKEVRKHQMIDYGHDSVEQLREKINAGKTKSHFTAATKLVSDDAAVISKDLHDFSDMQLYADFFVGSDKQTIPVIFDTGSNWFWVQSA